jgi:hypothetical protein
MPEMGTSGLTSGDGKRGASASVLAPILDSTGTSPPPHANGNPENILPQYPLGLEPEERYSVGELKLGGERDVLGSSGDAANPS